MDSGIFAQCLGVNKHLIYWFFAGELRILSIIVCNAHEILSIFFVT